MKGLLRFHLLCAREFFMKKFLSSSSAILFFALLLSPVHFVTATETGSGTNKKMQWSFNGIFGQYDNASIKRGYKVYNDICSTCHGANHLSFRNLQEIGFSPEEVKAIASQKEVEDGPNDSGQMFKRSAVPSDRIPSPFKNDQEAASANNGAIPPDLSLITKARYGGADYIYNLLTSYTSASPDEDGLFANKAFPTGRIAMPPPLAEGIVSYDDGTSPTVKNMAIDVSTFLAWAAEPELNERHRLGFKVILFILVVTIIFYFANRAIWSSLEKK